MNLSKMDISKDDSRNVKSKEDYTDEELKELADKEFDEVR